METIINQFPEYRPNQVLTEFSLNATSDFLEQQERLTRFGLTKVGIVENLEFKIKANSIQVEEGFGVSTDGYFLAHNYKLGAKAYSFAKPYKFADTDKATVDFLQDLHAHPFAMDNEELSSISKIQFYELLTKGQSEEETEAVSLSQFIGRGFKLVLYLEIKSTVQNNCSTTSCDTGSAIKTYRVVPLLVIDEEDLFFTKINAEPKIKNRIKLKRMTNIYQLLKNQKAPDVYSVLITEFARVNYQNTRTLLEKLNEILTFWEYPSSLGDKFKQENLNNLTTAIGLLEAMQQTYIPKVDHRDFPYNYGYVAQQIPKATIPKATAPFLAYTIALKRHSLKDAVRDEHPNAKLYFQTYYEFCNDLELAINELVVDYNDYLSHYFSNYSTRVKRMLVLGRSDRYNHDAYRYYVIENFGNNNFRDVKNRFFKHFNRVVVLISKFQQGFSQLQYKTEIKLIPSRMGNCSLEDRAIPYYYKQDLELDDAWMVSSAKSLKTDIYQYRDLKAPYSHFANNISSYDFIRVEGLIGKLISKNLLIFPWLIDFSKVKIETAKQQKNFINKFSKNLYEEANSMVNNSVQKKIKEDIAATVIDKLKGQLTDDISKTYTNLEVKDVQNMVGKITVDLNNKITAVDTLKTSEVSLNELDKQIEFFNIPIAYKVVDLDGFDTENSVKYLESSLGTKMGGTLVLFTKRVNQAVRVVASFMEYF